jgi:hypothetical protein
VRLVPSERGGRWVGPRDAARRDGPPSPASPGFSLPPSIRSLPLSLSTLLATCSKLVTLLATCSIPSPHFLASWGFVVGFARERTCWDFGSCSSLPAPVHVRTHTQSHMQASTVSWQDAGHPCACCVATRLSACCKRLSACFPIVAWEGPRAHKTADACEKETTCLSVHSTKSSMLTFSTSILPTASAILAARIWRAWKTSKRTAHQHMPSQPSSKAAEKARTGNQCA